MGWTIKAVAAVALTQLTGCLALLCWSLARRALEGQGYLNALYRFLRLCPLFFLCPLLFLALWFLEETTYLWGGVLFWPTPC